MTKSAVLYLYANFLSKSFREYRNIVVDILGKKAPDNYNFAKIGNQFWNSNKIIKESRPTAKWHADPEWVLLYERR
jgi:hypothetical protein